MKKIILSLIIFIFCVNAGFSKSENTFINVGLILNAQKAAFRSNASFKIFDVDKNKYIGETNYVKIFAENGLFKINDEYYKCKKIKLIPGEKPIAVFSDPYYVSYRGNFILYIKSSHNFSVINEVKVNEYLVSVLGSEVSPAWPIEALKAQAVAARTYVLYKKERNELREKREFDVVDTVKDQVYSGISSETSSCKKAVYSTDNLVMYYNNKIIKAYYHSCCGGYTQDGNTVFEEGGKYLQSVRCPYCIKSKPIVWKKIISSLDLKKALETLGEKTGKIYFIEPEYYKDSERMDDLIIFHTYGESILSAVDLRVTMGPSNLKSTNFKIIPNKTLNLSENSAKKKFQNLYDKEGNRLNYEIKQEYEDKYLPVVSKYNKDKISVISSGNNVERMDLLSVNILNDAGEVKVRDNIFILSKVTDDSYAFNYTPVLLFNPKSKKIKIPVSFILYGKGWGHGVGMCQWGAYGMAKEGYDFKRILNHYYTGIKIEEY